MQAPRWPLSWILLALAVAACGGGAGGGSGPLADGIARATFDLVNQHRTGQGLDALGWDGVIAGLCDDHSLYQLERDDMSHDGFESERWPALRDQLGAEAGAENVAYNWGHSDPAATAFDSWLNSAPHRVNMEGNYNRSAIGVAGSAEAGYYFTQIFARVP